MRYELQTLFANGEWQNPNGETHATLYDVEIDLREMIAECEYAVSMGYMEDFNAADWRVQECENNDL